MIICKGSVLTADAIDLTFLKNFLPGLEEIPLSNLEFHKARSDFLAKFEKKYLEELLTSAKGSITEAAKIAKVRRQSLYRMLKRHNLTPEQFHIT